MVDAGPKPTYEEKIEVPLPPPGAGLLALLFVMFYYVFVTFSYGVLGQVGYLIVSISNLCLLTYYSSAGYWIIIEPRHVISNNVTFLQV